MRRLSSAERRFVAEQFHHWLHRIEIDRPISALVLADGVIEEVIHLVTTLERFLAMPPTADVIQRYGKNPWTKLDERILVGFKHWIQNPEARPTEQWLDPLVRSIEPFLEKLISVLEPACFCSIKKGGLGKYIVQLKTLDRLPYTGPMDSRGFEDDERRGFKSSLDHAIKDVQKARLELCHSGIVQPREVGASAIALILAVVDANLEDLCRLIDGLSSPNADETERYRSTDHSENADIAAHCLDLLECLWWYPTESGPAASWAVKESEIVRGNMANAKANPGLGVALFTTETAWRVFGRAAMPRILKCIDWGVKKTLAAPPYFIQIEVVNPSTSIAEPIGDIRHSLALGILMSRFSVKDAYRRNYVDELFARQLPDGGWGAVEGSTTSDLTTVLYGMELLCLTGPGQEKRNFATFLSACQGWLSASAREAGGWKTGIKGTSNWDLPWTSAYILQRIAAVNPPPNSEWNSLLCDILTTMLRASEPARYADDAQRVRVEARIAAACAVCRNVFQVSPILKDRCDSFMSAWLPRTLELLSGDEDLQMDVATATFLIRAFSHFLDVPELAKVVMNQERPNSE